MRQKNEKRKYIRIPSVLPVQIIITDKKKNVIWKTVFQGFTRDINEAGVCIEVSNFDDSLVEKINSGEYLFKLSIDLPNKEKPIKVFAEPRWIKSLVGDTYNKFAIGVLFLDITEHDVQYIVKYAYRLHRKPKQILALVVFFMLIGVVSFFDDLKMRYDNARLTKEIEIVRIEKERINKEIIDLEAVKRQLEENFEQATFDINVLEQTLAQTAKNSIAKYEVQIKKIKSNRKLIEQKLEEILQKEDALKKRKDQLVQVTADVLNKKFQVMYNWLKENQVVKTGLVHSYKGDPELEDIAFTYDQALVIMNFTQRKDYDRARELIDFFIYKARKKDGGYLNSYNVNTGTVMEWTAHVGPNVWLGMAILKYIEATGDRSYLKYVYEIANFVISMQDAEGGVKGGPEVTWYATEHNIDCYSFFRMMYTITNNRKFRLAADKVFSWIKEKVYLPKEHRFMRGKNDFTIATDTVSFGIPAFGAKVFYENGIDPEQLIKYIERNTKVKTKFKNNKGQVFDVVGFDYTKPVNIGREGVVSTEWTAQMVTTYQTMSEYFETRDAKKAKYYANLAKFYLEELDKLLISSPYEYDVAGLPYASHSFVDTGHGWATPRSPYAISVAGTAYTLLAFNKNNPFSLEQEKEKYYL